MKKTGEITYVKKIFKVLVVAMGYRAEYQYRFQTSHAAVELPFASDTQTGINQVYEIKAIDTLIDGKPQHIDKIVHI